VCDFSPKNKGNQRFAVMLWFGFFPLVFGIICAAGWSNHEIQTFIVPIASLKVKLN
jgi:hypothetical protein